MELIYDYIHTDASEQAYACFNRFAKAIWSLERFPGRGSVVPESKKLRQLIFGKKPNLYRIIFTVDKRTHLIHVLHIRHGSRAPLSAE
jgi:plasmid stabilization system protein ParE